MMIDLGEGSATQIARLVAEREISPVDVAEAVLARIDALDPKVHAFSQVDREDLYRQAHDLAAESGSGNSRGPLHGVPVAVKEWYDVRGYPSLVREPSGVVATEDATIVSRLRSAGALIVGKTHVPADSGIPPTRNPWNLDHSPGASSSGSAAAVACRMVPLAVGSQTGGSNLRPAAYCGVAAVKPSYGVLSRHGLLPAAWSQDHPGLIGRNMHDLALALSVVAGRDPRDPTTHAPVAPTGVLHAPPGTTTPRIGLVGKFFSERADPVMRETVAAAAARLGRANATVAEFVLPADFPVVWDALEMGQIESLAYNAGRRSTERIDSLDALRAPYPSMSRRTLPRVAELIPGTYFVQARRIRRWFSIQVSDLMRSRQVDALLMPAAAGVAPRADESTGASTMLSPWSFLGFPAISISGGLSPDGLPLGLQLVAAPNADDLLLWVGAWCESVLGVLPAPRQL